MFIKFSPNISIFYTFVIAIGQQLQRYMATEPSSLYKSIRIGLTGSIGMGKSTVTKHFQVLGFPVFDADMVVHKLYAKGGGAVEYIREVFPQAIEDEAVSRAKLAEIIMKEPSTKKILENIVHPLVAAERNIFFEDCCRKGYLAVCSYCPLYHLVL